MNSSDFVYVNRCTWGVKSSTLILRLVWLIKKTFKGSHSIDKRSHLNTLLISVSLCLCLYSVCLLGNRSLKNEKFETCAKTELVKNKSVTTDLWPLFCDSEYPNATCDEYFLLNNLTEIQAIPGLLSGVIKGEEEDVDGVWARIQWYFLLYKKTIRNWKAVARFSLALNPKCSSISFCSYLSVRQPLGELWSSWYVDREENPAFSTGPGNIQRHHQVLCLQWHLHLLHSAGGDILPLCHR